MTPETLQEGPSIQELTRHLAECPQSFLEEPIQANGEGEVQVRAVVADLLRLAGRTSVSPKEVAPFAYSSPKGKERNWLRMVLVACWLMSNRQLLERTSPERALAWLTEGFIEVSKLLPVEAFVNDSERREELARLCLAANQLLPLGEKEAEAENRLDSLSTVKRDAVIREAQIAEERARKLKAEMAAAEAARLAASVYSNE